MGDTKIEWTDRVWNPTRGCSLVSPGCKNCYAMRQAHRFSGPGMPYDGLTELGPNGPRWTGRVALAEERLEDPLRWKKPCRIFVDSMSDLFHEALPFAPQITRVFATMGRAHWHTFQILTKRASRLRRFFETSSGRLHATIDGEREPFPNVWLGVSVENQAAADARIPDLLRTPAAVRFLSCEPLLGPIDLSPWLNRCARIDWVIVGCESGPGARPCDVAWVRELKAHCRRAGVALFVKQLGAHVVASGAALSGWPINTAQGLWSDTTFNPPRVHLPHKKGGDPAEWPEDLRVREFPAC